MTRALIAGGGIGGLTVALALHRRGIEPIVLEQTPALEGIGAGVQLAPNANQVLADLDLVDPLRATAVEPDSSDIADGCTGRILVSVPLRGAAEARYGQPYLNLHRGDLHRVLARAVADRVPDAVRLGARVTSVSEDPGGVRAVLADGIHSSVREAVFGAQHPRFTGHVAYRMLVPARRSIRRRRHDHLVVGPGWDSPLHAIFAAATDVHKWALLDRAIPPSWTTGRVTLLGDSCHAMRPYLAQGAAMAIEDAGVLAHTLGADADISAALRRYQDLRMRRVTRVHATVAQNARVYHLDAALARFARNTAIRALGRAGDTAFLRRFDWPYGHEPQLSPTLGR